MTLCIFALVAQTRVMCNLKFKEGCNGIQFNSFYCVSFLKVHVVSDYMGLTMIFHENIVAKANNDRLVVLRKTSSVLSYKV